MEYYSDTTNESASSIWELLNPLKNEKEETILQPIDSKLYIKTFPIRDAPSIEPPFPTQNAVDSGTLYVPFTNGMSLAYSRAVMATEPTDKKLHSSDTVTMCYHTSDLLAPDLCSDLFNIPDSPDNTMIMTKLSNPPHENEILESVLHATALYLSEGSHALKWANSVKDILILDGPIFPVALLGWHHFNTALENFLFANGPSRRALKAYIDLIDSFVKPIIADEPSPPLIGFVKRPRSTTIKSTFNRLPSKMNSFIWPHDSSFFKQILSSHVSPQVRKRATTNNSDLVYTNWFISKSGIASLFGNFLIDHEFSGVARPDHSAYDLTFFMIYDPRIDVVFRVESPYAFSRNPSMREKIENFIFKEMAIHKGTLSTINKADHLSRMSNPEKESIGKLLAAHFHTRIDVNYNCIRWGSSSMDQLGYRDL